MRGENFGPGTLFSGEFFSQMKVEAAGRCEVVVGGRAFAIDRIEVLPTADGLRAFGYPAALVLRLLHRRDFRLLRRAAES